MKIKIILVLTLIFAEFANIIGQTVPIKNPDFPFIEVTGFAEQSIVPDEIIIAIKIKERYKNKEKVTIKQQEDSLKYYLTKGSLNLNNLTLANVNSDYVQVNWTKKAVLTETNYLFKAVDVSEVEKVFQIAEMFMFYDAYISKVNHSKLEEYKNEIRIKAIKNAKEKADQMLNAIGFQTGKPWIVQENTPNVIRKVEYENMATKEISSISNSTNGVYDGFGSTTYSQYQPSYKSEAIVDPYSVIANRHNLTFSKIKIVSNVYVKYEIK